MDIARQLRELEEMRASGALSDAEFQLAKSKVLGADAMPNQTQTSLLELQNELARIDREWDIEREQYKVAGRYNSRIPQPGDGVNAGITWTVFGGFWTAGTIFIATKATAIGAPAFFFWAFPVFGVFFILSGLAKSAEMSQKAKDYEIAEGNYQNRRAEILSKMNAAN